MLSETRVAENAVEAFKRVHAKAEHTAGVRAIDGDELNLQDMKCLQKRDGSWVCTLPHLHPPLTNLTYEFVYSVKDDLRKAEYSCKEITKLPR
jgi:hypothetical protein